MADYSLLPRAHAWDDFDSDTLFEGAAMFYRSADILITTTHVIVFQPVPAQFHLEGIERPYIVRHGWGAGFRAGHEIRARYEAADVRIFFTTNRSTFGAVRRALIRALEHRAYQLPI